MKLRESLITGVALAAIALVSVLAYRHEVRPEEEFCKLCSRPLHAAVTYELDLKDGTHERTCCPRCAMHYQVSRPEWVDRGWATDLGSGKKIAADSAFYVEGGDVEYCTVGKHLVRKEPASVAERDFDRCLPTLVAFATRDEAEAYRSQHGGRVVDFSAAIESVKER